ncbi:MAG: UvrD-helicase domain-containing protein, partial [Planctomycetaceae bacterium]|nr:UvrD-helicase domain-containing protein [Planctomycetaceae bacterium]
MSAHLSSLNPPQREAVLTREGPLLVLAGAGTGKTRVITYRMAELIRQGVPADRILSVTFTNKAAKEMGERTKQLLEGKLKSRPFISTFHALCVRILRQEIEHLGYPKTFAIYDRGDQESAARTALRECRMADSAMRPGDLLNYISRWKMAGHSPRTAPDLATNDKEFLAAVAFRRYQNNIKTSGGVDFDDLLLLTSELFQQFPEVLAKYQEKFRYVQI